MRHFVKFVSGFSVAVAWKPSFGHTLYRQDTGARVGENCVLCAFHLDKLPGRIRSYNKGFISCETQGRSNVEQIDSDFEGNGVVSTEAWLACY